MSVRWFSGRAMFYGGTKIVITQSEHVWIPSSLGGWVFATVVIPQTPGSARALHHLESMGIPEKALKVKNTTVVSFVGRIVGVSYRRKPTFAIAVPKNALSEQVLEKLRRYRIVAIGIHALPHRSRAIARLNATLTT